MTTFILQKIRTWWSWLACVLAWAVYFGWFWSGALVKDAAGSLVTGHVNMWGDWAVHITMTSALAYRSLWLSTSPLLIDAPFRYPFAANWLSAALTKTGLDLVSSMVFVSFLASVLMVISLLIFFRTLLQSKVASLVATNLFLLNGGSGFVFWIRDLAQSDQPLKLLLNPAHEYTRLDVEYMKFINVIDSMIIPQRAFAVGFPLALLGLGFLLKKIIHKEKFAVWEIGATGFGLGLLSWAHTHSFLHVFLLMLFWGWIPALQLIKSQGLSLKSTFLKLFFRRYVPLIGIGCITGLVSLIIIFRFYWGPSSGSFLEWYPGWYAKEYGINWIWFWIRNWWVMPIVAGFGWLRMLLKTKDRFEFAQKTLLFLPFFILFAAVNLWLFQPFIWDNTKYLVWVSLGFSGLAGWLLVDLWQQKLARWLVVVLGVSLIWSGLLDAYWISQHHLHSYTWFTAEELTLAEWVRSETDPNAIWLTGDQHNHWLYGLTGRQPLMAFRGWMWTHGYEYYQVEQDVRLLFTQPDQQLDLFDQYNIEYVVIGPNEKETWLADPVLFDTLFKKEVESQHYSLYRTQ